MIIGSYWPKKPTSMRLGFDTNEAKSQELLKAFTTERQGWPELKAVKDKKYTPLTMVYLVKYVTWQYSNI